MSIQALRERLAALKNEANHILAEKGDRVWSKEDQAAFDGKMDEADRVSAQIAATQRLMDADAEAQFKDADRKNPIDEKHKNPIMKGFELFLRKKDRELSAEEAMLVRNTMSTTTGSEGGNTVQTLVAKELIDYLKAFGFMRAVASQITTENGANLSYPTSDGTAETGEWIAQNVTATAADPSFGSVALNVFKSSSKIVAVPYELLQDSSIDIVAMVMKRLRDRIGRIQNVGFTTGSGTGQPNGIVTAATVGKTGTTGQTLTIIYDDLVDLVDSIDVAYLEGTGMEPKFMMSQTMRRVVRKIKDTAGRPIWTPSYDAGITQKSPDMLLGYPVQINNDMAVPAANAKSLAFGALDKYLIRDAMEVNMFRFDDSAYAKLGQVGFLAWARTGGNLLDTNAVKLYQHSAT